MNTNMFSFAILLLTLNQLDLGTALDQCVPYSANEYIPFDFANDALINSTLDGSILSTGSSTSVVQAAVITGAALRLSSSDYVDLGFSSADRSKCIHSPDACSFGFTLHLALQLSPDISTDKYYLSNGGDSSGSYGISIGIVSSELTVRVTTLDQEWEVKDTDSSRVTNNAAYYVGVTWDRSTLKLYESGILVDSFSDPVNRTHFVVNQNSFFFGRSTSQPTMGDGSYDEFIFWEEVKTTTYLQELKSSQSISKCIVKCEDKPSSTDSFQSCDGCNLYWDCQAGTGQRKVCRSGYTFDSSLKYCTATASTCPEACSMDPCVNNGTCTNEADGWLCHCNVTAPGWEGDRCELDIDECLPNPCVVNNTVECIDGVGGLNNYTCDCKPGYNLTHCENYDNCLVDPCENGATCYDDETADNYTCVCVPGYEGYNCSVDINECAVDNCQNGATCNDHVNMYNCTCPPGYHGFHCEFYDECYFNPCVNGTCSDGNQTVYNDYTCNCTTGFIDRNCSTELECITQNVTCQNGGTCMDLQGGWECQCVPGYTDMYCETDIDECGPEPCENGATCANLINDYNCTCVPGFVDRNCSTNFDECASGPCQHSGLCTDLVDEYNCTCTYGYNGTHCEFFDECSTDPCEHGGTCLDVDLVNETNHMCSCVEGFYGDSCEHENGCVTRVVVCQHGGTCLNTSLAGDFECDCVDGYDGTYCENDINECASEPCQNGGQCNDLVNMYSCNCTAGFSDTYCSFEHKCQTQNVVCRNNGTCDDVTGTCLCPQDYTGDTCQLDNPCVPNPCVYLQMESGTCNITDNLGSYQCVCDAGYSGQHCEVSPCSSAPCQNGATCVLDGDSFTCACVTGFTGTLCQSDAPSAGAQTADDSSWKDTSVALIVILVLVIAAVVIVTAVLVYKYKHRHNKVSPDDSENQNEEDGKPEEDPIAPFQNGRGSDPWEGRDVEFEPSNEAAPATFDGGETMANGSSTGPASAIPPKPKQPNPIDGPVVGGLSPPPKYEAPVPVETPAPQST